MGQCGHGLSCRPKESPSPEVLDSLLVLFGYNRGSSVQLIQGSLKLGYCKRPLHDSFLLGNSLQNGEVSHLVTAWTAPGLLRAGLAGGAGGSWVSRSWRPSRPVA